MQIVTLLLTLLTACIPVALQAAPAKQSVPLVYVADRDSTAWLGVQQAIEELNQAGRPAGIKFTVQRASIEKLDLIDNMHPVAIIAATDAGLLERLFKSFPHYPILNTIAEDNQLRRTCKKNLLHIIPSIAMLQDAVAQWQHQHPNVKAQAVAWHSSFREDAAPELNSRYQQTFGAAMDSAAWAGWAATKAIGEAVLRSNTTQPDSLLYYMREHFTFDGHKGTALSFRPNTGQLRQPVLLVENGKVVGKVPDAGPQSAESLDSLGSLTCARPGELTPAQTR